MRHETVLKAMVDGTRRKTLSVLGRQELSVSELVEVLNQPQSTVSRHLKVLRDAGLICDRREGKTVLYSLPASDENPDRSGLSTRMLEWIAEQPIPVSIVGRLDAVMGRRRDMSRTFFDRVGRQWDALREESFGCVFHLEAFVALLPESWTVADVGSGTGYLLPTLARHFERVLAVEPVDSMLEAARNRVAHYGLENVEVRNGELASLPINDSNVDLAVAVLVLHHVPAPRDALAELHRIVRPDGRVLLVEQSAHQSEAFRDRMQDRWWGFDAKDFCGLLETVGFEQVKSHGLATAEKAGDAPELFAVTGRKGSGNRDI